MTTVPFKFTIADQEFEAIISKEDYDIIQTILKNDEPKKKTGYERANAGEKYYYDFGDGSLELDMEKGHAVDDRCYNAANYYSSEEVARNNARADKLMRKLRRFAVERRSDTVDWNSPKLKHFMYYDYDDGVLNVSDCYVSRHPGQIYFDTIENAYLAIETFHDELIWYFTEYKDSM